MKSPKTTILGILTILGAVISGVSSFLQGHVPDYAALVAAITGGIGLITAADSPAAPPVP